MADRNSELPAQERTGKAFPVSWDQFHRDCRALTWRLNEVGPFHAVIAITRGGLVPAAIVARELGLRVIDTVCIAGYHHKEQAELQVLKGIGADNAALGAGAGKGLLIVDDLVDTGKTGRLVREMLPEAHFAAVYAKPKGRPLVDTFITEVSQDTWIHFPWDTALSFQPPIRPRRLPLPTCRCKTASGPPARSSLRRIAACSPATAASSTIPQPRRC